MLTFENCDFYVEQSSMNRAHRKQKRRLILGMSFHKEGECHSISIKKKRTSPDCLKIRRICIETLDYCISVYIILLLSYFNAFTCSWYVSNTYHSLVNFHLYSTYFIRSTPVYWSRLGRNFYGTDTYLPSNYTTLGMNICSVRVPSLPIWWRHKNFNQSAVLFCCVILDEHGTFT